MAGADINTPSAPGQTPIMAAAESGQLIAVKGLLMLVGHLRHINVSLASAWIECQWLQLVTLKVRQQHPACKMDYLMINIRSRSRCMHSHDRCSTFHWARPWSAILCNTCMHHSQSQGQDPHMQAPDLTAVDGKGRTALHFAAVEGHAEIAAALIAAGALVDAEDGFGATALHHAVKESREACVVSLLQLKASILPWPDQVRMTGSCASVG